MNARAVEHLTTDRLVEIAEPVTLLRQARRGVMPLQFLPAAPCR